MLIVKTYIGYLDSKWIYFDEENEVFQYNDQKNTSNWIMVAAPLYSLSFKRNCKCIKFSFWDLTVYDQYRYCNDWNSDSFRNVDDSEGEKKRSENWLENSYFEGKRAQNT